MGVHDDRELHVGPADDVAEVEADRTARIVVERLTTTPAPASTTSLGAASGWTSAATRSLFRTPDEPSTRVRRSSAPVIESSHTAAAPSAAVGRIRRAARAVPGSAAGPEGGVLDDATAGRIERSRGGGAPLDGAVRPQIESAFGADFSSVRVHADSPLPAEVGAVAFALGNDVHFGPGQYRPDTPAGLHTLSHELAHVVQQGGASGGIHRLMSGPEFKTLAKEKVYQVHGKTMTHIDQQLAAYDEFKANGGLAVTGADGIDKGITILSDLRVAIEHWAKSHAQDKSREPQREAISKLLWEVVFELTEVRKTRKELLGAAYTGELQVERNKFVTKMEGSASSVFEMLSPIVAAAIPSPGDGAQLEVSVKIPVDPSTAGYVGFSLGIGLQRQDRTTTKISLNAAVNGGLQVMGVADVGLELGAFIEAQGKDPKSALQLLSWGWYRRFRESKLLPREVASFMWGGSTGAKGYHDAEMWAANVEKENFTTGKADDGQALSSGVGSDSTTNAYVRTGAYGSAAASGKLGPGGIASLEGSATLSGGTHYDKDTITARKGKRKGELGKAEKMPTRGTTEYLGTRFMKFEAGLSAGVGPFSGSLGGALEWMWDQSKYPDNHPDPKKRGQKKGVRLEYLSAGFSAGATVPLGGMLADQLSDGIIKLAPQAINLVKMLSNKASAENKTGVPEGAGQLVAQGEAMATAFGAFPQEAFSFTDFSVADEPTATLAEQLKSGASVGESASTISINIAVGVNLWDPEHPLAIDITLNSEQGIQLDASIVSVKAVRSRRIVRLKIGRDKKWTASVD